MLALSETVSSTNFSRPASAVAAFAFGGRVGRPKKAGQRHPCGKLVQDAGPHETALARRAAIAGGDGRDPRAGYPLGILYLRGLLLHGDHAAGLRFAALHATVWGNKSPPSHLANMVASIASAPSPLDDDAREKQAIKNADQLGEAITAVKALGTRRPFDMLENVVVYERPMRFMDTSRARSPAAWAADQRDLEALRDALDCLARLWKIEREA